MRTPDPVSQYITKTFVKETLLQIEARLTGNALVDGMQVSPYEGKLLAQLAHMVQARHILEVGTFVGYSTLWLADALPDDGTIITLEARKEHALLARHYFQQHNRCDAITLIEGDALESLSQLDSKLTLDFIFIDAAKAQYPAYFHALHPHLRSGGFMVADNTLLFGHMAGQPVKKASKAAIQAMQDYNHLVAIHKEYRSILIPTQEGLTISQKR